MGMVVVVVVVVVVSIGMDMPCHAIVVVHNW